MLKHSQRLVNKIDFNDGAFFSKLKTNCEEMSYKIFYTAKILLHHNIPFIYSF
jgi:hypothetical protein